MQWFSAVLTAVCLAVGLLHALRAVTVRAGRVAEASSAVLALGMAAMFSPAADPVPEPVWAGAFLLCAVAGAVLGMRRRPGYGLHHVLCAGAMIFMALGHGEHMSSGGFSPASVAALVLAGYFAWHVLRCVDRLRAAPAVAGVLAPRTAATAHLVTTVAMSGMLVAMI